ncbi:hypothetical protein [Amorphus sp. MBR-141]
MTPPMTSPPTPADTLRRMIAEAEDEVAWWKLHHDSAKESAWLSELAERREALKVREKNDAG